jgi:hypothetical protein
MLGAWIIRMSLAADGSIIKFRPEMYPYFDRKIYAVNTEFHMPGLHLATKETPQPVKIF